MLNGAGRCGKRIQAQASAAVQACKAAPAACPATSPPVARTASTGQANGELPEGQTYICESAQASQNDQAANEGDQPADGDGGARHGVGWAAGRGRGNTDALWSTISDTASGVHQCSWRGERGGVAGEHTGPRRSGLSGGRPLAALSGGCLASNRGARQGLHAHFMLFVSLRACRAHGAAELGVLPGLLQRFRRPRRLELALNITQSRPHACRARVCPPACTFAAAFPQYPAHAPPRLTCGGGVAARAGCEQGRRE